MNTTGASVAVFSEDAKDMFPDPSNWSEDDDEEENDNDKQDPQDIGKSKVNKTINSCVVSLKFKNTDSVKFSLKLKANTSGDTLQRLNRYLH